MNKKGRCKYCGCHEDSQEHDADCPEIVEPVNDNQMIYITGPESELEKIKLSLDKILRHNNIQYRVIPMPMIGDGAFHFAQYFHAMQDIGMQPWDGISPKSGMIMIKPRNPERTASGISEIKDSFTVTSLVTKKDDPIYEDEGDFDKHDRLNYGRKPRKKTKATPQRWEERMKKKAKDRKKRRKR